MKSLLSIFIFSLFFISCNNRSGFSQEFKDNFTRECVRNAQTRITYNEAEKYCSCVLGVVMTKYNSDQEADSKMLNMSMNDLIELTQPCQ